MEAALTFVRPEVRYPGYLPSKRVIALFAGSVVAAGLGLALGAWLKPSLQYQTDGDPPAAIQPFNPGGGSAAAYVQPASEPVRAEPMVRADPPPPTRDDISTRPVEQDVAQPQAPAEPVEDGRDAAPVEAPPAVQGAGAP